MYIIYHCVGGTHSSAVASAVHLGFLPIDRIPEKEEILNIPYFDTLDKQDQGKIILRGIDDRKNKVFTLSRQFSPQLVIPAIKDAFELGGGDRSKLIVVNTMPAVNTLMKIGGFTSRRLNFPAFGRPIVALGSVKAYPDIIKIVKSTKKML